MFRPGFTANINSITDSIVPPVETGAKPPGVARYKTCRRDDLRENELRVPAPARVGPWRIAKLLGAVLVGFSVGTLLSFEPVALPVVGSVPALLAGGVGILVGGGIFLRARKSSDCGCSGDCGC